MLLENKIALVTGAAGRLGRAITEVYLREGAIVVMADLDGGRVKAVAAEIAETYPGKVFAVQGDQSQFDEVQRMVAEAEAFAGLPDLLANAHGIFPNCSMLDVTVEEWDSVFNVNTRGTMLTCQALSRKWIDAGVKGSIINISSGAARSGRAGGAHYSGSKAAVELLTHIFAIELGQYGIRVNAVAPGLILDNIVTETDDSLHPYVNLTLEGTPIGRTGAAIDVAEAAAFLTSDRSSWTTGAILEVTGGTHTGRTHMPFSRQLR
ncbi:MULTISPECIES: SDR family oxidoreductase [unclassified Devosia]|uniref:SDR family NAD(P)-dependent oxidoreductase n=1 Tax=unclassified Devosia TaxID=196773 RepID=UPI0015F7FECF|nr:MULTISPECIES: SDR family oxidoreductase [unclassified Devosia]MBJ6986178.1 SDR family oxidoreductase [Devosia sp. MC521]MBK1792977.1 SDR family oxidoreductase [Devosia sp. WQ 349K1]QMW64335.1 SDR family oxidoreductase [Devosia sp. MC521]